MSPAEAKTSRDRGIDRARHRPCCNGPCRGDGPGRPMPRRDGRGRARQRCRGRRRRRRRQRRGGRAAGRLHRRRWPSAGLPPAPQLQRRARARAAGRSAMQYPGDVAAFGAEPDVAEADIGEEGRTMMRSTATINSRTSSSTTSRRIMAGPSSRSPANRSDRPAARAPTSHAVSPPRFFLMPTPGSPAVDRRKSPIRHVSMIN